MGLGVDALDFELGHLAAMADSAVIPFAAAIFVTDHLRVFILPDDFCDDRGTFQCFRAGFDFVAVREK